MITLKFRKLSLEENIELIEEFYHDSDYFKNIVINYYDELKELNNNSSKEEINIKVKNAVTNVYNKNESSINNAIINFNNIWSPYHEKYIKALESYFNIKWDSNDIFNIDIGFTPICPRFLDENRFILTEGFKDDGVINVIAHELLHFIWFKKWMQLYPDTKREEMDSPHLIWELSEMVTDSILNSKEIQTVFNNSFKERSYNYFYDIKFKDEFIMDKIKEIFESNITIEEKIKNSYNYIQEVFKNE